MTPGSVQQVNDILVIIEAKMATNPEQTVSDVQDLNDTIKQWCESEFPPSAVQLQNINNRINDILSLAETQKHASLQAIIKHQKSNKAISAYSAQQQGREIRKK